jgi:DNA-binding LytR/AlgR family response regulator
MLQKQHINEEFTSPKTSIIFKSGHEFIKLPTESIIYIKSDTDYTEIIMLRKMYLSKDSLKQWLEKLNKNNFHQIHKSYLINIEHINKISRNLILTKNKFKLPLARAYKKNFIKD